MWRLIKNLFIIVYFSPFTTFSQTISRIESVQSLYIEMYKDSTVLGSGTGFIIRSKTRNYLVTNYHVVTNRKAENNAWIDLKTPIAPNRVAIVQNAKKLGEYVVKWENLLDKNGNPLWHENRINNEMVDVIELPLNDTSNVAIYPVTYNSPLDTTILLQPTDRVFVLGFPLGIHSAPFMPLWKSGIISSEPDINQENKPIMWVDINGIGGMSGSPVYYVSNQVLDNHGNRNEYVTSVSIFLGVFSHGQPNIYGALWKSQFLKGIFDKLP